MIKILFWNPFVLTDNLEQLAQKKLKIYLKNKYNYKSYFINYLKKNNIPFLLSDKKYLLKFQKYLNKFDNPYYKKIYNENLENYLNTVTTREREWSKEFNYFNLKTIFKLHILAIEDFLKKNKITHMFASPLYSSGFDYIFFIIAKKLNIRTFFIITYFRNKMFYSIELEDFGEFKKSKKIFKSISTNNILQKNTLFYMKKKFYLQSKFGYKAIFLNPLKIFKPNYIKIKLLEFKKNIQLYKFWKQENSRVFLSKNLPKNYLYFPIHYQPEASTIGMANDYIDQAVVIEKISNSLPKKYKLIVKEHPAQFNSDYLRSDFFYERIKNLKNVLFTNVNDNHYNLVEKSKAVIALTGNSGWDAIRQKKHVISFGLAWYNCLDYVFKWRENLNIKKILETKFSEKRIIKTMKELTKKMPDGIDSLGYQDASDFTSDFKIQKFNFEKEIPIIARSLRLLIVSHN